MWELPWDCPSQVGNWKGNLNLAVGRLYILRTGKVAISKSVVHSLRLIIKGLVNRAAKVQSVPYLVWFWVNQH